ncbi:hypothetical protein K4F52_001597 [Lecanicillium sp. MT-2017a]|nr:hypothetical protein K4F52_001597 [Lecanicillium sp. MT-2017a]
MAVPKTSEKAALHEHETSAAQGLWETEAAERTHIDEECHPAYTPTSTERLWKAAHDHTKSADDPNAPETVLYLAYGSNMCAQTFLGMRKIRPLSEMNVSAPSLNLTFDLPGVTYLEPCFANVEYRNDSEKNSNGRKDGEWDGSVVGVVYEVTKADWRNIMRTEGGGASYNEIQVPCVPLPRAAGKGHPAGVDTKALPETFLARTLYAPRLPKGSDPSKRPLWERLTTGPYRPEGTVSQPSLRYLKLLRVGAKEHDLPAVYREYLDNVQPYTMTSTRQRIGKWVIIVLVGPLFLLTMRVSALLADESGKSPKAAANFMTMMSNTVWTTYDYIMKPIFGDGEKTMEKEKSGKKESANGMAEKDALLDGDSH